jgi:hypothetical protein
MRTLIICLSLLGCSSSTKPTTAPTLEAAVQPEGAQEADQATPPANSCIDDCMRRNMARAVAADQIEADCDQECGDQLPVAKRLSELALQSGKRLIIQGRLERATGGFELHLSDGNVVRINSTRTLALEAKVGTEVALSGRYQTPESGPVLNDAEPVGLHIR